MNTLIATSFNNIMVGEIFMDLDDKEYVKILPIYDNRNAISKSGGEWGYFYPQDDVWRILFKTKETK